MGKDLVVTALLGIVLVVALFQAVQVSSLSGRLGELSTAVKSVRIPAAVAPIAQAQAAPAAQQSAPPAPAQNVQAPANIANLPSQVGGC